MDKKTKKLVVKTYDDFEKEYHQALLHLEKSASRQKDILLESSHDNVKNPKFYQNYLLDSIERINKITNITKEFNKKMRTVNVITYEEYSVNNKPPKEVTPPNSNNINTSHPSKFFNYPKSTELPIGYEGECIISYVRNNVKKQFFIHEFRKVSSRYRKMLTEYLNVFRNNPLKLSKIPDDNSIFGCYLDNCLFRAVKETQVSPFQKKFKVFLIDVGEILEIDFDKTELYNIPDEHKSIPAQAELCVLDKVNYENNMPEDFLEDNDSELTFKVMNIKRGTMYIELKKITNPFYRDMVSQEIKCLPDKNSTKTDPLLKRNEVYNQSVECLEPETELNRKNHIVHYNKNNPFQHYNNFESIEYYAKPSESFVWSSSIGSESNNNIHFSTNPSQPVRHEEGVLFEQTKTTVNALEAVMGYTPRDEQKICKYYDPSTKACFKGANCKLQHLPPVSGGWSRETLAINTAIPLEMIFPDVGSQITIIPTHIVSVELLFAQIIDKTYNATGYLKELNIKINAAEYVSQYKEYDQAPAESELVLARYKDRLWYRARVSNVCDDNSIKVFYLDYGNCSIVSLNCIRKWNNHFSYLPFQAVPFRIDNVREIKEKHFQAVEELKKSILNKSISATVVDNKKEEVLVLLTDPDGFDVGEQLVAAGMAIYKKTGRFST